MTKNDNNKIMIIGSGPIIIGQACEFDYSGTQACKALKMLGYEVVLVNSNPATIMTDPETADATYIEPLNVETLEKIIEKERPFALLPSLGGQTGLNLSQELAKKGILEKYGVKLLGVQLDAIERGEDRIAFKETMVKLNIDMPRSAPAYSVEEAEKIAGEMGYPVVVRPAYTMGGTGGGIVYNIEELRTVVYRGIAASMVGQVLIEECVLGWEELELEVIRDKDGRKVTVCYIENVDPMGVHTGDSFCVAPTITVSEELKKRLQDYAYRIVDAVGVIGGCNVQFAHDPVTDRVVIIEINPRTSRSSALASKATGFPIAYVSALLAAGITLPEIPYWKKGTLDKYIPEADYIVVKFARWAFEKFKDAEDKLGTQMHAVGEVMSIGKSYKEAFQKAIRSLETGRSGLGFAKNYNQLDKDELFKLLAHPTSERQYVLYEAFRKGATIEEIHELTKINRWFLEQMKELVEEEEELLKYKGKMPPVELLERAKINGFSDKYLAQILEIDERELWKYREEKGIIQRWEGVNVSGIETESYYYYSTYEKGMNMSVRNENSIMVLGGGPNRIGQGIEFDYCCVHAAKALRELGFKTIMVNCNPETVSTDYDTSDKLYFEPLTAEDIISIYNHEKPLGIIVQFGGQTPLNIADELQKRGARILGTPPAVIDAAEDRDLFNKMMNKLQIPMPESGMAINEKEAIEIAERIGYPVMVRPSFVLGGRGMEIIHDSDMLKTYMAQIEEVAPDRPVLIDKFLDNALECEADAISDGENVFVPAVMEHIEQAGVHSGDSACVIPSKTISQKHLDTIYSYTAKIAIEIGVVGLMNIQYAIYNDEVYVLEANPRASRTVPLVSKVCAINMAQIATNLMVASLIDEERKIDLTKLKRKDIPYYGVKEAVLPFNMFPEVDPVLGPEMRSTGEVLGLADTFGSAFFKSQVGANGTLPVGGNVLISVNENDRQGILEVARGFKKLGFHIIATIGTSTFLSEHGIETEVVKKLYEGRPNITDLIVNGRINLIINTPSGKQSMHDDSYIRKSAIRYNVPYITTIAAANAAYKGIEDILDNKGGSLKSLQEYHAIID